MFSSKNEKIMAISEESNSMLNSHIHWGKESEWMSDWNSKMNPPPKKNKEENSGARSLVLALLVVKYLLSLMFLFVKW